MSSPEGFDNGDQGDTLSAGDVESTGQVDQQAHDQQQSSGSGDNPAWNDLLSAVPTQFHSVVKPKLQEWDRNYSELAQNYAPYKTWSQQGVSQEQLKDAYQLYNQLNNNPQYVYDQLGRVLGTTTTQQQQQQKQKPLDESSDYEDDSEESQGSQEEDPRMQQMQQELEQLRQQNATTQQQVATTHFEKQIDTEIQTIKRQHGDFNVPDVMNRFLAQIQRGEQPSVTRAYEEQQGYNQWYQSQSRGPAPKVMSPNGGMPSATDTVSLKTSDDRVAAMKALIAQNEGTS